jgi:hypothetical protein
MYAICSGNFEPWFVSELTSPYGSPQLAVSAVHGLYILLLLQAMWEFISPGRVEESIRTKRFTLTQAARKLWWIRSCLRDFSATQSYWVSIYDIVHCLSYEAYSGSGSSFYLEKALIDKFLFGTDCLVWFLVTSSLCNSRRRQTEVRDATELSRVIKILPEMPTQLHYKPFESVNYVFIFRICRVFTPEGNLTRSKMNPVPLGRQWDTSRLQVTP